MWLFIFILPIFVLLVIGGLAVGGIFTLVLLPIAFIIAAVAVIFTLWGKSEGRRRLPRDEPTMPAPNATAHVNEAPAPTTPSQLTDARRQAQ
jgi:hypothetical protein